MVLGVVVMTTSGASNDDGFGIMTTFGFRWRHSVSINYQSWMFQLSYRTDSWSAIKSQKACVEIAYIALKFGMSMHFFRRRLHFRAIKKIQPRNLWLQNFASSCDNKSHSIPTLIWVWAYTHIAMLLRHMSLSAMDRFLLSYLLSSIHIYGMDE